MLKSVTPYLFFNGTCKVALDFYSEALGGSIKEIMTYGEANQQVTDDFDRIIHGQLEIDGQMFMLSDIPQDDSTMLEDRNVYIVLEFDSESAVTEAYERLKDGGEVQMELADMFWGAKYAKLVDKYDIGWDLSYTYTKS
ncbi:glyoxalase/bleomycin resistance/extradiol dioxygenase family protein [Staphylococcus succinus]|uniref:VOC family protein n=1 Tax=Staphylococcus succinus TaxID=61015 RepID=A0A9Q6MWW6_9STAP|nr:glyoxalase/bleomycin resistance/extradiol dioxygenase family protein [Staphylococcus succinus]MEB8127445.1 glyoxalase/bleomycin resistance/extradiol dioxygenase family protein [Staphylococcus succinus]MEB8210283.1 glyoxalase/bleomycin resistance/extradiol dioxygenase family protein [Staphylococcus succinus]PTI44248.1 VOC family protein [Staphylococcus succinus]PTI77639.1 VOC family protein [Staphylococcus succinus]RIN29404.1 glyoxalase/bleomycin resistance/extradiol dioxygenase family prote